LRRESTPPASTRGTARISRCGGYRYLLTREWDSSLPGVGFVMLNPSTADAARDDPTIRRCTGFARAWGFGAVTVGNLYAFRSVRPSDLPATEDAVGPGNDAALDAIFSSNASVVAAWGSHPAVAHRLRALRARVLDNKVSLYCLGTNVDGQPRHPLYIPRGLLPMPYDFGPANLKLNPA
jgi:hypothetical protein